MEPPLANTEDASSDQPKKPILKIIFICIMFVALAVVLWRNYGPAPNYAALHPIWYYNLAANKLVRAEDQLSPVRVNGMTLVRAYVFSCGECTDAPKRYVGYLEQIEESQKDALAKFQTTRYMGMHGLMDMSEETLRQWPAGSLQVRLIKPGEWVDAFSPEGEAIRNGARHTCSTGEPPRSCDLVDFNPEK